MEIQINITNSTPAADAAMFRRLRNLLSEIVYLSNRNDQAAVMIGACIEEGMDEARRLLPAMEKLGFNRQHAAIILKRHEGTDPNTHWWTRDASGRYSLHASPSATTVAISIH